MIFVGGLFLKFCCVVVVFIDKLFLQTVKLCSTRFICMCHLNLFCCFLSINWGIKRSTAIFYQFSSGFNQCYNGPFKCMGHFKCVFLNTYAKDIKQHGAIRFKFSCLVKHFQLLAL